MFSPKQSDSQSDEKSKDSAEAWAKYSLLGVVLFVAVFYAFHHYYQSTRPPGDTWVEKVRLESGEVIVVTRNHRYGNGLERASGGPLVYASMEFEYRGQLYKWAEKGVIPLFLEIDSQQRPVVGGDIGYRWALEERGKPCDLGVVQYYSENRWVQIPSWTTNVSTRMNISANLKMFRDGKTMASSAYDGNPNIYFTKSKERCLKEAEDVQLPPN